MTTRINVNQKALTPEGQHKDQPAVLISDTDNPVIEAHEAAITCPCCGHAVAIVVQPPNIGPHVWIETDGVVTAFARAKRNDRTSYGVVGRRGPAEPDRSPELEDGGP